MSSSRPQGTAPSRARKKIGALFGALVGPVPEPITGLAPAPLQRHTRLFAAVGGGLVVLAYLLMLNPYWHYSCDSALYLALGRSLHEGRGYVYQGLPHAQVPSGMPFFIALLLNVSHRFLWLNVAQCLTMLTALAVLYVALRQMADKPTALLIVFLSGVLFWIHEYAVALMSETPFFLFSNLSVLLLLLLVNLRQERYRAILLAGVCATLAAAFWFRVIAAFWIGPFVLALALGGRGRRTRRDRVLSACIVGLVIVLAVCVQLHWMAQARAAAQAIVKAQGLRPAWDTASYYGGLRFLGTYKHFVRAANIPRWFLLVLCPLWDGVRGSLIANGLVLAVAWGCFGVVLLGVVAALRRGQTLAGFSALYVLPFAVTGAGYSTTTGRYAIAVAPFVILLFLAGLGALGDILAERVHRRLDRRLMTWAGIACVFVPNAALLVGDVWVQRQPSFYAVYRGGAYAPFMGIARWLSEQPADRPIAAQDLNTRRTVACLTDLRAAKIPRGRGMTPGNVREKLIGFAQSTGTVYLVTRDRSQPWPIWHIPGEKLGGKVRTGPNWRVWEYSPGSGTLRELTVPPVERWPTRLP